MIASDFYVEPADWQQDRAAIVRVRESVFIVEQGVPEDEEFDRDDETAHHFVAYADNRMPIGTARLTQDGRIGRVAVEKAWRGKAVGAALIQSALDLAREQRLQQVRLAAQTYALGFYERFGFRAYGEEFDDVGIPHRWMRMMLKSGESEESARRRVAVPIDPARNGMLHGLEDLQACVSELIRGCRGLLELFTPRCQIQVFDTEPAYSELRTLLAFSREPQVRVLIKDSRHAVETGHRWIPLAQRRPTAMEFRNPARDHATHTAEFLLIDRRHMILRENPDRFAARAIVDNPLLAQRQVEFFAEAWEYGSQDPNTRRLAL